jgi:hypothetical protein
MVFEMSRARLSAPWRASRATCARSTPSQAINKSQTAASVQ